MILGAADPILFTGHERGNGAIGFSSAYYERKNPERILGIIRALPHRKFILLGKGWKQSRLGAEISSLRNLESVETSYADYPAWYAKMDVFVSASDLEGGPIPLIEAMM